MENLVLKTFESIIQYMLLNAKDIEIMIIMFLLCTILLILQKNKYETIILNMYSRIQHYEDFINKIEDNLIKYENQIPFIENSVKSLIEEQKQLKDLVKEKDIHIKYLKKNK